MLIGMCWPYLDQEPGPAAAWELLGLMGGNALRVCSNMAADELAGLSGSWPGLRFVVRAKFPSVAPGGQRYLTGEWRPGLLDYREWPSEPSLRDTLGQLLGRGHRVDLELINEPDVEWDRGHSQNGELFEASALDCLAYLQASRDEIAEAFGGWREGGQLRIVSPAFSQGWELRSGTWEEVFDELNRGCDAIGVHAYTNGRLFSDPGWGGRPLRLAARYPGKPLVLSEVNDNGAMGVSNPGGRGELIGAYLGWLEDACPAVDVALVFSLPGQRDVPEWWAWDGAMVDGLQRGLAAGGFGEAGQPGLVPADATVSPPAPGPGPAPPDEFQVPSSKFQEDEGRGTNLKPETWNLEQRLKGAAMPEFVLGFKTRAEELGVAVVGEPKEDQWYDGLGNAHQYTTRGKFEWIKRLNLTHFFGAAR